MADCTGLENRSGGNSTQGSNPCLSALFSCESPVFSADSSFSGIAFSGRVTASGPEMQQGVFGGSPVRHQPFGELFRSPQVVIQCLRRLAFRLQSGEIRLDLAGGQI